MSNEAKLAAGTIVSFSLNLDTPAYTVIPKITNIGGVGLMSEAKETTTLSNTNKTYGAGLQDAPDKSIKGQYIGSDTDQKAFRDAAKLNQSMLIKIEFPDKPDATGTGTVAVFNIKTLGFEMDEPTGEEWLMFTVNAKQNTDVTWTDPASA